MRIYTTQQGEIFIPDLKALWVVQVRYLLTTLLRYAFTVPRLSRLMSLRYLPDPRGADTWFTPEEAVQRGGDDCEGLSNLLCARLLINSGWKLPAPIPCLPVLARFGHGHVIHAICAVQPDLARQAGFEQSLFTEYPIIYPSREALGQLGLSAVLDPSWMCGMGIPLEYTALCTPLPASAVIHGDKLHCEIPS